MSLLMLGVLLHHCSIYSFHSISVYLYDAIDIFNDCIYFSMHCHDCDIVDTFCIEHLNILGLDLEQLTVAWASLKIFLIYLFHCPTPTDQNKLLQICTGQ